MSLWIEQLINLLMQYGIIGLAIISFTESSFFPIPPDLLLIPMAILNPELAIFYAFITTIASVIGGLFGYLLGEKAGRPLMKRFFKDEKIKKVESYFNKYGGWAVLIAGLTPIPYKVFTIASGVFKIRKVVFIVASIFGRGIRFFIEALFIYFLGEKAKIIITQYFDVITVGASVALIIIYFIYRYIIKRKANGYLDSSTKKSINRLKQILKNRYRSLIFRLGKLGFYMVSGFLSAAVLTLAFALFQNIVMKDQLAWLDSRLYSILHSVRSYYIYDLVNIFNMLGSLLFILIIVLAVAMNFYSKYNRMTEMMLLIVNLTGAFALNDILMNILYPYTSEYSLLDFSFYGILLYIFIINYKKKLKVLLGFLIFIIPFLTGLSRLYTGIQNVSGIIAGALCAAIWITICIVIHKVMLYYELDKW